MKLKKLFPAEKASQYGQREELCWALIAFLCSYISMLVGMSALQFLFERMAPTYANIASLFGTALAFVPMCLFFRYKGTLFPNCDYIKKEKAVRNAILGFLIGFGGLFFLLSILVLFGGYAYVGASEGSAIHLLLLPLAYLVQGSAEELLCRGFFMPMLCARYGGTVGAAMSAAFFALMHAMNPGVSVLALLNIFLFGLLFASVTQRARSVWPVCGLHAGWNFAQSFFGLQVSGNALLPALLRFESRIPWLTGGAFGPEGSILLTAILFAVLLALVFAGKFEENK